MRTFRLFALIALALTPAFVARHHTQDAPEPAKKVDTAALLQQWRKANGKEREKLAPALLQVAPAELQQAITKLAFEPREAGLLELKTACPDGHERPYWVNLPPEYDPAKAYPLIVCLHGGVSGTPLYGRRMGKEVSQAPGEYALTSIRDHIPAQHRGAAIMLGCSAGVPETHAGAVWWALDGQRNVLHFIAETKRQFNVDDNAVFITGHSDGASGTFGFAYRMPDTFAGFFAQLGHPTVAALDDSPVWLENLKGLDIYAFNGAKDQLYPSARVTPVYDQANALGAKIRYKSYGDLGHDNRPVLESEVARFFTETVTKTRRDALPATLDWSCTKPERGRRAWLEVAKLGDLGKANAAPDTAEIVVPGLRVRLGVQLRRETDPPTVEIIVKGSVAETIGVKVDDQIVKLDETTIGKIDDLLAALEKKQPGDEFTLTVKREGKETALKGTFPKETTPQKAKLLTARVIAKFEPGKIELTVRNTATIKLHLCPAMLGKDGSLRVIINGEDAQVKVPAASSAYILRQFENTADRTLPFDRELVIDVAALLGNDGPGAPDKDESDDDF